MSDKRSKCWYCGVRFSHAHKAWRKTIDHLTPKCRGGDDVSSNIVESCQSCNGDKGSMTLEEYRLVIAFRRKLIAQTGALEFPGERFHFVMGKRL